MLIIRKEDLPQFASQTPREARELARTMNEAARERRGRKAHEHAQRLEQIRLDTVAADKEADRRRNRMKGSRQSSTPPAKRPIPAPLPAQPTAVVPPARRQAARSPISAVSSADIYRARNQHLVVQTARDRYDASTSTPPGVSESR